MSSRVGFTLRSIKRVFRVCFVAHEHTCVFEVPAVQREPHEPRVIKRGSWLCRLKGRLSIDRPVMESVCSLCP